MVKEHSQIGIILVVIFCLLAIDAAPPTNAQPNEIIIGRGIITDIAWSPQDDMIAVASGLGIRLYTPDFVEIGLLSTDTTVDSISWNSDASILATSSLARISLWDMEARPIFTEHSVKNVPYDASMRILRWSPKDDSLLAVCGLCSQHGEDIIVVFSPLFGNVVITPEPGSRRIWSVAWSPLYRQIAIGTSDGSLHIYDVDTSSVLKSFSLSEHAIDSIAWQGQWLVATSQIGGKITAIKNPPDTPQEFEIEFSVDAQSVSDVVWFSETEIIFREFDSINLLDIKTQTVSKYADFSSGAWSIAWSTDRTRVLNYTHSGLEVRDIVTNSVVASLEYPATAANEVTWSPNGKLIAVAYREATQIFLIDADTREFLRQLEPSSGLPVHSMQWGSDGETLVVTYSDSSLVDVWKIHDEDSTPRQTIEMEHKILSMSLHPDGQILVVEQLSVSPVITTRLSVVDIASGDVTRISRTGEIVNLAEWGPSEGLVTVLSNDGRLHIVNIATSEVVETIELGETRAKSMVKMLWNSDGSALAGVNCQVSWVCELWWWDGEMVHEKDLREAIHSSFQIHDILWDEDSILLAVNNELYLYDITSDSLRFVNSANDTINAISLHSFWIAVASDDGTVRLWAFPVSY